MGLTPNSGGAAYCSPAAFLAAYEDRIVGQLVGDGTPVSPSDLLADPVLAQTLAACSGDVETACLAGERYAAADLAALVAAGGNGAAMLATLVADLAIGRLRRRRGLDVDDLPQFTGALATLDKLRGGESILPFVETEIAGVASSRRRTYAEQADLRLLSNSFTARRFMGPASGCGRPY